MLLWRISLNHIRRTQGQPEMKQLTVITRNEPGDPADITKALADKAINVENIEPMAHAHPIFNTWRKSDEVGEAYDPKFLMQMAPEQRDNQVVVPKVVE